MRAAWLPASKSWVLLVDFDRDIGDDPGKHLTNDWPDDVRSLRLRLVEQPGEVDSPPCGPVHTAAAAPRWDLDAGVLTLFLPKGHIARLRYASFVHDRLVGHFGLPNWQAGLARQQLRAEAMAGANWMLTPWRDLTLVHATQHPVCPHSWSTSACSASRARRTRPCSPAASTCMARAQASSRWSAAGMNGSMIPQRIFPSGSNTRRCSPKSACTTTMPTSSTCRTRWPNSAISNLSAARSTTTTLAKRPAAAGNRHEFGDTRFRFVRYFLRATTRFREYLPPELFADAKRITHDGPVAEIQRVRINTAPGLDAGEDAGAPVQSVTSGGTGGIVVPASLKAERSGNRLRGADIPLGTQWRGRRQPGQHPARQRPARVPGAPVVQFRRRRAAGRGHRRQRQDVRQHHAATVAVRHPVGPGSAVGRAASTPAFAGRRLHRRRRRRDGRPAGQRTAGTRGRPSRPFRPCTQALVLRHRARCRRCLPALRAP